jgi:hypothetical protein
VGGRAGAVEGEDGDLLLGNLVKADPPVRSGAPDRASDGGGLLAAVPIVLEHIGDLLQKERVVHGVHSSDWQTGSKALDALPTRTPPFLKGLGLSANFTQTAF